MIILLCIILWICKSFGINGCTFNNRIKTRCRVQKFKYIFNETSMTDSRFGVRADTDRDLTLIYKDFLPGSAGAFHF